LSDEAFQDKSVVVCVVLEAVKLVGVEGACVSAPLEVLTVTVLLLPDSLPAASTAVTLNE